MAFFNVAIDHDAMNHEDAKHARAIARKLQLNTKSTKYYNAKSSKFVQKETRQNKSSETATTVAACERTNPHRATRAAKRSSLSKGEVEAEADMPTWSRGLIGLKKPSVSPTLRFCLSSAEDEVAEGDFDFGSRRWIEDAETTAADVTDSAADNSDSQDSTPELENPPDEGETISIADLDPFERVTRQEVDRQAQEEEIAYNLMTKVEREVKEMKAAAEATALAQAESIVTVAKMQAESEARAIKTQAFTDACSLKARVESQAQAKAEATLVATCEAMKMKQIRKAVSGLEYAKDLDKQRAHRQRKQTHEERCFHQGLDKIRSKVEAECCEVKEKALAEAKAAKARATAEARTIRANARSSAKVEARRERRAVEVVAAEVLREVAESEVESSEVQVELGAMRSCEPARELVDVIPASPVVTQDAGLPPVDVDAGWEVIPDSSFESILGWDVIV